MTKSLEEIHPGEILRQDFMLPLGIDVLRIAAEIEVSPEIVREWMSGVRPITTEAAQRLGRFFSMEPVFWLNLQCEYAARMRERANTMRRTSNG